ncbi:hypothetical protein [Amycolatopsis sp. 195334CR]|uniref:hypothetical protein n=1 Tax=Amycolatopsis sp. 195334CR TaxID=2814588 RepID=UPI001A8F8410|nr:hypothetical protein [Amycolatopsis sp. 195334CR]MBN6039981.1 hypothetical protein [Amycolatopsis sp. 195334CR]
MGTAHDDLSGASVPELLGRYAAILAELRERGVVRTRNAPLGDYAEHLATKVYGGTLAANWARESAYRGRPLRRWRRGTTHYSEGEH